MPEDTTPETAAPETATPAIKTVTVTIAIPVAKKLLELIAKNDNDLLKSTLEGGGNDCSSSIEVYDITKGEWRAPGTLLAWIQAEDRDDELEQTFMNAAIVFAKAYVAHHDDPVKNPKPVVQDGWIWVDEDVVLNWFKGVIHDHGVAAFQDDALEDMARNPDFTDWPFQVCDELLYDSFVHHIFKK